MPNYKPKRIDHKALARRANRLTEVLDEAIDTLEDVSRRERLLTEGAADDRAGMAETYPALKGNTR